ncbi:MAG: Crp/Fnr family transcriptional regulator [Cyclobacteriaceae bacterium]
MIEKIRDIPELWSEEKTLKRNEFLVRKGDINSNTFYVDSGAIRVFLVINEEEHTIRFGYHGSIITPLHSFFEDDPSPFYFQAIRKTVVRCMPRNNLRNFIDTNQEGRQLYTRLLEELILQQMEREVDILTSSPAERLKRVLDRSPELFREIPLKYIASYLRMSPETLSRIANS